MPRQNKKPKPIDARKLLLARPLTSTNFGNLSEIDVYIEATDTWETVATINSVGGIDAEDIAAFIVSAVAAYVEVRGSG